tara:strand:- start:110 stop:670 length:561 start_codon:yes stop_codon:yes gene_type:complete
MSEDKYVILCETSGEEMEQWYYFIKVDGNEKALKYLNDQLEKVEMFVLDDLSTFELDLENNVSATTAKELTMVDINSYTYHRKFDGKLQYIDFKLKRRDDNEDMIEKIHDKLAFGDIDKFIDNEDKNGKDDVIDVNELDDEDEDLVPKPDEECECQSDCEEETEEVPKLEELSVDDDMLLPSHLQN